MSALERAREVMRWADARAETWGEHHRDDAVPEHTLKDADLRALVRVVEADMALAAHEQRQPNGSNDGAHRAWYDEMIRLRREHAAALTAATEDA